MGNNKIMNEVIWIVIVIITSCVWIAKRLYFDYKISGRLSGESFFDVLICTILIFLFIIAVCNESNKFVLYIALTVFLIGTFIMLMNIVNYFAGGKKKI